MASGGGLQDLLAFAESHSDVISEKPKSEKPKSELDKINILRILGIIKNKSFYIKNPNANFLFDTSASTEFENFRRNGQNLYWNTLTDLIININCFKGIHSWANHISPNLKTNELIYNYLIDATNKGNDISMRISAINMFIQCLKGLQEEDRLQSIKHFTRRTVFYGGGTQPSNIFIEQKQLEKSVLFIITDGEITEFEIMKTVSSANNASYPVIVGLIIQTDERVLENVSVFSGQTPKIVFSVNPLQDNSLTIKACSPNIWEKLQNLVGFEYLREYPFEEMSFSVLNGKKLSYEQIYRIWEVLQTDAFIKQRFDLRKSGNNLTIIFNSNIDSMGIKKGIYDWEEFSFEKFNQLKGQFSRIPIRDMELFLNAFREVPLNNPANTRLKVEFDRMVDFLKNEAIASKSISESNPELISLRSEQIRLGFTLRESNISSDEKDRIKSRLKVIREILMKNKNSFQKSKKDLEILNSMKFGNKNLVDASQRLRSNMEQNISDIRNEVAAGESCQDILEKYPGIKTLNGECGILFSDEDDLSLLLSEKIKIINSVIDSNKIVLQDTLKKGFSQFKGTVFNMLISKYCVGQYEETSGFLPELSPEIMRSPAYAMGIINYLKTYEDVLRSGVALENVSDDTDVAKARLLIRYQLGFLFNLPKEADGTPKHMQHLEDILMLFVFVNQSEISPESFDIFQSYAIAIMNKSKAYGGDDVLRKHLHAIIGDRIGDASILNPIDHNQFLFLMLFLTTVGPAYVLEEATGRFLPGLNKLHPLYDEVKANPDRFIPLIKPENIPRLSLSLFVRAIIKHIIVKNERMARISSSIMSVGINIDQRNKHFRKVFNKIYPNEQNPEHAMMNPSYKGSTLIIDYIRSLFDTHEGFMITVGCVLFNIDEEERKRFFDYKFNPNAYKRVIPEKSLKKAFLNLYGAIDSKDYSDCQSLFNKYNQDDTSATHSGASGGYIETEETKGIKKEYLEEYHRIKNLLQQGHIKTYTEEICPGSAEMMEGYYPMWDMDKLSEFLPRWAIEILGCKKDEERIAVRRKIQEEINENF